MTGKVLRKGKSPWGRGPSGKGSRKPLRNHLSGSCTIPSCDYWHPPACQNYKSESGCKFGEKCTIRQQERGWQSAWQETEKECWKRFLLPYWRTQSNHTTGKFDCKYKGNCLPILFWWGSFCFRMYLGNGICFLLPLKCPSNNGSVADKYRVWSMTFEYVNPLAMR